MRGVWRLLTRPGLIQIHFDDLCALVRDRHSESVFASVEAAGPARAREVVEKLLAHPLLDEGRALAESDAVLVSLMGGQGFDDGRGQSRDGTNQPPMRARANHHGRGGG